MALSVLDHLKVRLSSKQQTIFFEGVVERVVGQFSGA